jgi:hypothetical protein
MTHDTESERGLPELPQAAYSLDLHDGHPVFAYSAQQMYNFGNAAIEKDRVSRPSPVAQDGDWADGRQQRWEAYAKRAGFLDIDGKVASPGQAERAQTSWFTWEACEKAMIAAAPLSAPKADEEKP